MTLDRPSRRIAGLAVLLVLLAACGDDRTSSRRVRRTASPSSPAETFEAPTSSTPGPPSPTASGGRSRARVSAPRTPAPGGGTTSTLTSARVKVTRLATFNAPVAFADPGDGAFYIAEQRGTIQAFRNGSKTQILDISGEVSTGGEQGLLGLAFSPDRSRVYVNFTDRNGPAGNTVIREYRFSSGSIDAGTARQVLTVEQPYANHNGGHLVFGLDGRLYIGLGDGGSGGDPQGNAQNLNVLLGKMLRIDPSGSRANEYSVPPDNPFAGPRSGRDEIWAYGLRNPWRYSFDRANGDLYIADVGQGQWEEISFAAASSRGGENYGWDRMEGTHPFEGTPPPSHSGPIFEYRNDGENCAVAGGYVYRGSAIPDLRGAYVFSDFCGGRLRAFVQQEGRVTQHRFLDVSVSQVSSFGEDARGELYVLSLAGGLYRLDRA